MPDLQFYRSGNERSADQKQGLVRGRADLVVEVVSPSSRRYDRVTKLGWYARLGVPEYWIVDLEARTLERLVLHDGTYVIAASLEGEETFRPETFEGLEIPLAKIWSDPSYLPPPAAKSSRVRFLTRFSPPVTTTSSSILTPPNAAISPTSFQSIPLDSFALTGASSGSMK